MTSALRPLTLTIHDGQYSRTVPAASVAAALALSSAQVSWALRYLLNAAARPPGSPSTGEPTEGDRFDSIDRSPNEVKEPNRFDRSARANDDGRTALTARGLAETLGDVANLGAIEELVRAHDPALIDEALRRTQRRSAAIRSTPAAYFTTVLKNLVASAQDAPSHYARTSSSPP